MPSEGELPESQALDLLNKQLDRYQAVVSRLADNQVQVKTWCVTALAALASLAINNGQRGPLVIGLVAVIAFFFLDAYYLSLERHFRDQSRRLVDDVLGQHAARAWSDALKMEGPPRGKSQCCHVPSCAVGTAPRMR